MRAKKFNLEKSNQSLENFLVTLTVFPAHFTASKLLDKDLNELLESNFLLILPTKSENYSKRIHCQLAALNQMKFSALLAIRLHNLLFETLFEDENFQIAGLEYILDFSETSHQVLDYFSITDYRNVIKYLKDSFPIRLKSCILINVPSTVLSTIKLALQFLPEKLKNRITILDSETKQLPNESHLIVEKMRKLFLEKSSVLQKSRECDMTIIERLPKWALKATPEIEKGITGKFRHLNVD